MIWKLFSKRRFLFFEAFPSSYMFFIFNLWILIFWITVIINIFFFHNILFQASGFCLLVIGLWMQLQLHKYMEISSMFDGVATIPGVFLCLGGSIILFSTLACCCTAKGKVPLLYMVWYSHSASFKILYNLVSHISYIYPIDHSILI